MITTTSDKATSDKAGTDKAKAADKARQNARQFGITSRIVASSPPPTL